MPSLPKFQRWWRKIKERWDEDYWALSDEEFAMAGWEAGWQTSAEEQRERWSYWIGNKLTQKHPEHKVILWAIAEAIERDNFGVVAEPSYKDDFWLCKSCGAQLPECFCKGDC